MTVTVGRGGRSRTVTPVSLVLAVAAAAAWIATVAWIRAADMSAMPGTMNMSLWSFTLMWGLMMAAMMLPSVSPFVVTYQATITQRRVPALSAVAAGYLIVWTAVGVVAYYLAWWFGRLAADRPGWAQGVAVATFAAVGAFQLTPLKFRCLSHCRSPVGHLMHYLGFRGPLRHLRTGASHGAFCLGCCWALMVLMVAFGVMNVAAMVGLAVVIALEKVWSRGEQFARAVGVACLAFAVALVFEPGLAPGLDPDSVMPMNDMGDMG
jgi:predicted metal-binding membrane protein